MRPPGRTTRAISASEPGEVDEVAQGEAAREAVDRRVGQRQVQGVGLDERRVGAWRWRACRS